MNKHVGIFPPKLDLPRSKPTVNLWLVPLGARVLAGERIVEILADELTFDVSAPTEGRLVEKCIEEESEYEAGACLGLILRDGF
ncbi:MAG: hypothetical protein P8N76_02395 [Pirellulaceae bacterium]|nr:hypothetical protein [Pirellulaceae bacterium]